MSTRFKDGGLMLGGKSLHNRTLSDTYGRGEERRRRRYEGEGGRIALRMLMG